MTNHQDISGAVRTELFRAAIIDIPAFAVHRGDLLITSSIRQDRATVERWEVVWISEEGDDIVLGSEEIPGRFTTSRSNLVTVLRIG